MVALDLNLNECGHDPFEAWWIDFEMEKSTVEI